MFGIGNWLTPFDNLAPGTTFVVGAWPRHARHKGVSYYGKPDAPFDCDGVDSRILRQLYEKRWIKAVSPAIDAHAETLGRLGIGEPRDASLFDQSAAQPDTQEHRPNRRARRQKLHS